MLGRGVKGREKMSELWVLHGISGQMRFCQDCGRVIEPSQHRHRPRFCETCSKRIKKRLVKERVVEMRGGKCERCGFVGHPSAFDFHHRDPEEKASNLAKIKTWKRFREELPKCVLLCANCHRLVHAELMGKVVAEVGGEQDDDNAGGGCNGEEDEDPRMDRAAGE